MRLSCHAPHPDPRRQGDRCNAPLGQLEMPVAFVTTAHRMPPDAAGTWLRCKRCGAWNRFERIPTEAVA